MNIDKFDYCRTVCRTSSRSVKNENQWKSEYKYCFPTSNTLSYLITEEQPHGDENDPDIESLHLSVGKFIEPTSVNEKNPSNFILDEKIDQHPGKENDSELPKEESVDFTLADIDVMLNEMIKAQKIQEQLFEQLEQKMKQLIQEKQNLTEVNKNLASKLDQLKKGNSIDYRNLQTQQHHHQEQQSNGSSRLFLDGLGSLLVFVLFMVGFLYM